MVGGNLPKTCGPGIVCAAAEGRAEWGVGVIGVPLGACLVSFDALSFAVDDGTGRKLWPDVGFAGSSGGALSMLFGNEETGGEFKTSLYKNVLAVG